MKNKSIEEEAEILCALAPNDALWASNLSWVAGYNARFGGEDYSEVVALARLLMGVRRNNSRAKPPETAEQTSDGRVFDSP